MKRFSRITAVRPATLGVVGLLLGGVLVPLAGAQDPFSAEAGKAAAKGRDAKAGPVVDLRPIEPQLILQLRENNPTTGIQLVEAARLTLDFGRPDEAKKYLAKAIALKMDESQLEELAKRFGADLFVRLSASNVVRPEGEKLGRAVLLAHEKATKDPARQAKLLTDLGQDSEEALRNTRGQLAELGLGIAPVLITALAEPASEKVATQIQMTLLDLGPEAYPALIAVLGHGNSSQQVHVLQMLAQRRVTGALPQIATLAIQENGDAAVRKAAESALLRLMSRMPSQQEVEGTLYRRSRELLIGEQRLPEDANGFVSVWTWSGADKTVKLGKQLQRDAATFAARDFSQMLVALAPQNASYAVLDRVCRMEVEGILESSEESAAPASVSTSEMGKAEVAMLEKTLEYALKNGHTVAARKSAAALGKAGDIGLLKRPGGGETPLAKALVHRDVRVRLAAALSALELSKGEAFAGSSRMVEVLGYVAASGGAPRVLICEARKTAASDLAALMLGMGLEPTIVFSGKEALQKVSQQPDIDFVLIDDAVEGPRAAEMVQLLRRDYHSAGLPMAVLVRDENAQKFEFELHEDPLTIIVPRIYDSAAAGLQLKKLEALAGRNLVLTEERLQQSQMALAGLLQLLKRNDGPLQHEVHRQEANVIRALATPALTASAAEVLAHFATPAAQTALVEYADIIVNPLDLRQHAARRFAEAISRRGTLLTRKQIMDQYDRYNASETLDAGTQEVLGQVIDAIESRATPVGGLTVDTKKSVVDEAPASEEAAVKSP